LKHVVPLLSSPTSLRFATPLTVSFTGTHSLSGQSVYVTPLDGFENPATATVGEEFIWLFRTEGQNARSFTVNSLPPGVAYSFGLPGAPNTLGRGTLIGTPTVPGLFQVTIQGWRRANETGKSTNIYQFFIEVAAPPQPDPFQNWRDLNWIGDDRTDNTISGPNADPDGDGVDNLLEFFLDLNPLTSSVMPGYLKNDPEDETMLLYELPMNPDASDLEVRFETSETLLGNDWDEIDPEMNPDYEIMEMENSIGIRFPKVLSPGQFLRLAVTL